ncbi:MAG TPA: LOG family protein [Phycisphaerae bacterium]|nr:LOG family protein [Phycisphaerae bacterium]
MNETVVTVFGSGEAKAGSRAYQVAFELGQAIGRAGWTLCNGGYGGTMAATAAGAVAADGHTIGVTCAAFKRARPNPYILQEVPTFDLLQRLNTLVQLGRAYVVLPGATGTLFELAAVWELQNKRLLKPARPVVLLGEFWKPVVDCVGEEQPKTVPLHMAEDVASVTEILRQHFSNNT